jgi:ubiquinone/menaquinone biosynthesis C-methylase UbiE
MKEWIDYYDTAHSIYVNARHRDVHFQGIARHIVAHIPSPDAVVLDYSCGEALFADEVAAACRQLILVEPAPGVRARLNERFGKNPRIVVRAPDELAAMPEASVDLIAMVSVVQYMTRAELDSALAVFRRLLKPDGRLALGDVIAPETGAATDVAALLRFAAGNGFLVAALTGLVRTALSDYSRLRASIGLKRYSKAEMVEILRLAGLSGRHEARNMGHNSARMTFVATPAVIPATSAR